MIFNSLVFPVFLLVVFCAHWWTRSDSRRNLILLVASYVFYGWWDWRFLTLIVLSSIIDYICGIAISRADDPVRKRRWLCGSLLFNLGMLATFKYFDFFSDSAEALLESVGMTVSLPTLQIVVPVGISFYTFQTLSYTIDVYRGRCEVCHSWPDFFLFVAFFPQLVAGPIEKAANLLPQLSSSRRFDVSQARHGLRYILYGLLLKSLMADNLAPLVDIVYEAPVSRGALELLLATYGFAFQIYGDFAGYSSIAIGVAALLGVQLSKNFDRPYLATNVREFWQRWHISLSSWFSEYVYIAWLGGSRLGQYRRVRNIVATFLLSGLWHGAAWKFLAWGLICGGFYFIPTVFPRGRRTYQLANAVLCFHLICFAWIFFRANSMTDAFEVISGITSFRQSKLDADFQSTAWFLLIPAMLMCFEAVGLAGFESHPEQNRPSGNLQHRWMRWTVYSTGILLLFFLGSFNRQPFIYFQF